MEMINPLQLGFVAPYRSSQPGHKLPLVGFQGQSHSNSVLSQLNDRRGEHAPAPVFHGNNLGFWGSF